MPKLGVNIDHVATLRQARREFEPDPIEAARICERAGAHSIVCHLREDQRHIQEQDVLALRRCVKTRLNLEMSLSEKIVAIAGRILPDESTIVPERRQELTTEGGLDVVKHFQSVKRASAYLQKKGITPDILKKIKRYNELAAGSGRTDIPRITAQRVTGMLRRNALPRKLERQRVVDQED